MREQLNCPNCGAPITGEKCEYCGTLFYDFASIEIYKPSYIRLKCNGELIILKVIPTDISVKVDSSYATYDVMGKKIVQMSPRQDVEINISFRSVYSIEDYLSKGEDK